MMCMDFYADVIYANSTGSIAGLIVEPYLGTAGFIFPPEGWLTRLEGWAKERNFLITFDEVQSSFGRTGKMWSMEWEDNKPDIVAVGKGIGSGATTSAILLRNELLDHIESGDLGSTNGGNPISTAACSTVLEILKEDNLIENSRKMGAIMMRRLLEIRENSPLLGDVRGKGLAMGLELVKDKNIKEPAPDKAQALVLECARHGLLIGIVGLYGNVIRVAPPLVITEEQVQESLDIMEKALRVIS
ncbi:MAG: aminotransferase class III-fold pyridoxal phosphate-dependent enzyme [Spirochaetota bacterium]